jgi:hypothetical protein
VEAFLGQSLEVRRAQQLKIEAVVTADSTAGFIAKLSVTTAQATYDRRLDHQDCASLTEAAALVMALAIDPERVRAREVEAGPGSDSAQPVAPDPATTDGVPPATDPPLKDIPQLAPTPAAVPASAPTPAITDARPPAEPAAPAEGKPFLIDVVVRGLLDVGTLPRAAFGVGGVVGISRGSFRLELTGAYWFPVDEPVPDHAPAKVEVQLATGGLSGCFVSAQGAWDLAACMGGELGDYRGRGVDEAQ